MIEDGIRKIDQIVRGSSRILIVSHLRPDGDAVGSLLGLGLTLEKLDKDVQMVLEDGVPVSFRHLSGVEAIRKNSNGPVDCTIVVDCSDMLRTGSVLEGHGRPDINIDHHPTNELFANINLVVESAVSTTEILYEMCVRLGWEIPPDAAAALLTGLITDTIGFQTSNMTANSLRIAADLVDYGLDISNLYRKSLVEKSYTALKYWGAGLESLDQEDGLIWVTLTLADREKAGYPGRDDADLVNQLSTVRGSLVRIVFIEQKEAEVKVSWRSRPGYDVSEIARGFGGGGHRSAAGATISGSVEDVKARVLEATRVLLRPDRAAFN